MPETVSTNCAFLRWAARRSTPARAAATADRPVRHRSLGRQRRSGWRAAVASSSRRTGVSCGASRSSAGSRRASAATSISASAKASMRLDRFGLGRLDQQRLLDRQREVDRRRMEAVSRSVAWRRRACARRSRRAGPCALATNSCLQTCANGHPIRTGDPLAQVVGGQYGVLTDLFQSLAAVCEQVRVGPYQHTDAAQVGAYAADRCRSFAGALESEARRPLPCSPPRDARRAARAGRARACR